MSYLVEIDGSISDDIHETLVDAKKWALNEAENSGSIDMVVVIYESKEVLSGDLSVNIAWKVPGK